MLAVGKILTAAPALRRASRLGNCHVPGKPFAKNTGQFATKARDAATVFYVPYGSSLDNIARKKWPHHKQAGTCLHVVVDQQACRACSLPHQASIEETSQQIMFRNIGDLREPRA